MGPTSGDKESLVMAYNIIGLILVRIEPKKLLESSSPSSTEAVSLVAVLEESPEDLEMCPAELDLPTFVDWSLSVAMENNSGCDE